MTREDAYAYGFREGSRWARSDHRLHRAYIGDMLVVLRAESSLAVEERKLGPKHDSWAAECLGRTRGYRSALVSLGAEDAQNFGLLEQRMEGHNDERKNHA